MAPSRLAALTILTAGCQFQVLGLPIEAPADLAGADSQVVVADLGAGDDLSSVADLSSVNDFGQVPQDMAVVTPNDLKAPPSDLAGCVQISESFANNPASDWSLLEDANWSNALGRVRLNTLAFTKAGGVFLKNPHLAQGFDATFRYSIGSGTGADGLAFAFLQANAPNQVNVPGNGGGGGEGGKIGYVGNTGFVVEIDTYDSGGGDPNDNHVGFNNAATGAHVIASAVTASLRGTHLARVRYTGNHVTVWVDGTQVLDGALTPPAATPSYLFGFTAATGGLTDYHDVWDFSITIGPPNCY